MTLTAEQFIKTIRQLLPESDQVIPLHEPLFNGNESQYVQECLSSGWVSSVGQYVDRFEQSLQDITGTNYAIATVNGTAALHMAMLLAGVRAQDEVLLPTLSFVATANAISYCRATPHFVDSEWTSLGVNAIQLETHLKDITELRDGQCFNRKTNRPIRALCVVHVFGHPVDLEAMQDICERYQLTLIEDAAEALGSYYKGQHVGGTGLLAALSFNGNKIATTGGGGALLTNDKEIAKRAKHLTTTGKVKHAWRSEHDSIAYNYRLPNLNAALGCAQLEQLPRFIAAKRALAKRYQQLFSKLDGVEFLTEPDYATSNYWLNAIVLEKHYAALRDTILDAATQQQIGLRPVWQLLHELPMYQHCPRMPLVNAPEIADRLINLPSSASLELSLEASLCQEK